MDLALYATQAVLVERRSMRKVAAATGRSKSWVQRQVARYQEGGVEAMAPKKRGPTVAPNQIAGGSRTPSSRSESNWSSSG